MQAILLPKNGHDPRGLNREAASVSWLSGTSLMAVDTDHHPADTTRQSARGQSPRFNPVLLDYGTMMMMITRVP